MKGVLTLTKKSPLYPRGLEILKSPTLYSRGTLTTNTFKKTVGVVGSRLISDYAIEVMSFLIPQLVEKRFTIISGFSYGVDAYAHEISIINRGMTVAILPCGIRNIVPQRNKWLYYKILKSSGVFLAEDLEDLTCEKWAFAKRNRIIAALSDFVIVVEADEKSGSLITADFAFKYNKPVFFIPHRVLDTNSYGVNNLYKKGGIPINKIDPLELPLSFFTQNGLSKQQQEILELLKEQPRNIESLILRSTLSLEQLVKELSVLEINKIIKNKGGFYYVC